MSWHVLLWRRFQEHLAATASVPATDAAIQVLARADEAMGFHNQCGLTRADTTKCQYTPDGRLWETNKYGVYEVSRHAGLAALLLPCCCHASAACRTDIVVMMKSHTGATKTAGQSVLLCSEVQL